MRSFSAAAILISVEKNKKPAALILAEISVIHVLIFPFFTYPDSKISVSVEFDTYPEGLYSVERWEECDHQRNECIGQNIFIGRDTGGRSVVVLSTKSKHISAQRGCL